MGNTKNQEAEKDGRYLYRPYSVLRRAIAITVVVCGIMLILFFISFHGELSRDVENWGSFGCYFSSITGLLAFLGVLYSADQSEKRADEARDDFKKQLVHATHRDWFNKFINIIEDLSSLHSRVWTLYKDKYKNRNNLLMRNLDISQPDEVKILIRSKLKTMDILLDKATVGKNDHAELARLIKEYFRCIDSKKNEEEVYIAIIKLLDEILNKAREIALLAKRNIYLEEV